MSRQARSPQPDNTDRPPMRPRTGRRSGIYLESTEAEQLGVLPHECTRVKDAMSRSLLVDSPQTEIQEAVRLMRSLEIGVFVICDGTRLLGTLSERDIALANTHPSDPIRTIMTADPSHCFEQDLLIDALATMRARGLTALPVLNADGLVSGVVTKTAETSLIVRRDAR